MRWADQSLQIRCERRYAVSCALVHPAIKRHVSGAGMPAGLPSPPWPLRQQPSPRPSSLLRSSRVHPAGRSPARHLEQRGPPAAVQLAAVEVEVRSCECQEWRPLLRSSHLVGRIHNNPAQRLGTSAERARLGACTGAGPDGRHGHRCEAHHGADWQWGEDIN